MYGQEERNAALGGGGVLYQKGAGRRGWSQKVAQLTQRTARGTGQEFPRPIGFRGGKREQNCMIKFMLAKVHNGIKGLTCEKRGKT